MAEAYDPVRLVKAGGIWFASLAMVRHSKSADVTERKAVSGEELNRNL